MISIIFIVPNYDLPHTNSCELICRATVEPRGHQVGSLAHCAVAQATSDFHTEEKPYLLFFSPIVQFNLTVF